MTGFYLGMRTCPNLKRFFDDDHVVRRGRLRTHDARDVDAGGAGLDVGRAN